jgi:hypothetical protein
VRPVVGAVHHDRVLRDPEPVEQVEELADVPVVVEHRVVVRRLPAAGLPQAPPLRVRSQVHVGEVHPAEERLPSVVLALDEVRGGLDEFVVARLHPLAGQRPRVLDPLLADAAPARLLARVVLGRRAALEHPARAEALVELLEAVLARIVRVLRVLFRVQVVEVPEELVEPVHGRQELVLVPEVILAELTRRVAVVLEELRDCGVLGLQPYGRCWEPDLAEAGAEDALPGDERGTPGGAALLAVGIGEAHPLVRDAIDVRRPVTHQPVAVAAEVRDADVVAPDDEDVRLVGHQALPPSQDVGARTTHRKPRCAIEVSIICGCRAAGR